MCLARVCTFAVPLVSNGARGCRCGRRRWTSASSRGFVGRLLVTSSRRRRWCFFQAEDGIRDIGVTGVQTCALPICLSILGTTGVVVPYSCSSWIDSIRRGIDVARAAGHPHVAGCTGSTSERAVRELHGLPEDALLDMGDFAGAVLKYLRRHPVPRLTIAGGIGKLAKLADGHLDLHSGRSQVSTESLAARVRNAGGPADLVEQVRGANTALDALQQCRAAGLPLGDLVAAGARETAPGGLRGAPVEVDVVVIDRAGTVVGRAQRHRVVE